MPADAQTIAAALACSALAFTLSASVGFGGSLILVPALSLVLGTKQGVALAALLLACNNVAKVSAYRKTVPWRAAAAVLGLTVAGAAVGAVLLVNAPESWVTVAVIASFAIALLFEARKPRWKLGAPLALGAGFTSGFAGTSGPLKGVALRSLRLDRFHFAGAASLVSLGGDATKAAIYADAKLLDSTSLLTAALAIPVMAAATLLGRRLNRQVGEPAFVGLFWAVMAGYTARLVFQS